MDSRNPREVIGYPTSATDSSPLTHTLYPPSLGQTPSPPISIIQPPEIHISTGDGLHISPGEGDIPLEVLEDWLREDMYNIQTMPGTYIPLEFTKHDTCLIRAVPPAYFPITTSCSSSYWGYCLSYCFPKATTIKDITHKIRDLEVRIQQQLDMIVGQEGRESFDRLSILEPIDGKKCNCPVPISATQATEGPIAPAPVIIHRAGCPASDPMGLYGRSRLMELQDPDSDAKDDLEDDTSMTSEEDSRYHDLHLGIPVLASGTPAATFFELARSLGSPQSDVLSSPTGSNASVDIGLAGADYFSPNPAAQPAIRKIVIERERLPSYLLNGTIKPAECNQLFARFMSLWNVSVSVLDPGLHTSARAVLWRCPFLFTVVLAIAARDYKPEQYPMLMQEAKNMAGLALTTWSKSIEIVQAFILLATFPPPSRRWDEDRTWLYLGYATRMAGDLQLNRQAERPFPSEMVEREHLNRIRTWLICHNLDVSAAAKLGKQTSMQEDPVILGSRTWWKSSKYNMKFDIHLCGASSQG
ncbi:Protein priB [Rhizoctonia solani AG-1 IB]|uniref:Protein priB n=1 Tax=Thanatephorus cucumeris (strain AG1-IB / isolate 7/3/14) TaxID=1108050 RepID=M5BXX6_THACB|nr:Protein priB [Rhizoctonia solani AG-1 IB]